jgi:hypothetical protein
VSASETHEKHLGAYVGKSRTLGVVQWPTYATPTKGGINLGHWTSHENVNMDQNICLASRERKPDARLDGRTRWIFGFVKGRKFVSRAIPFPFSPRHISPHHGNSVPPCAASPQTLHRPTNHNHASVPLWNESEHRILLVGDAGRLDCLLEASPGDFHDANHDDFAPSASTASDLLRHAQQLGQSSCLACVLACVPRTVCPP